MDHGAGNKETLVSKDKNKSLTIKGLRYLRISILIFLIGSCMGLVISIFFHIVNVSIPLLALIFLIPLFLLSGLIFLSEIAFIVLYSIGIYNLYQGRKLLDPEYERNIKFGIASIIIWPLVTMIIPFIFTFFISLLFIPILFLPFGFSIYFGTLTLLNGILGFIAALTLVICLCVPVWKLTSGDTRKNVAMFAAFSLLYPILSFGLNLILNIPVFRLLPLIGIPIYLVWDALAVISIILMYLVFKSYLKIESEMKDPSWKIGDKKRVEVFKDVDLKIDKALKLPRPNITKYMVIGCILSLILAVEMGVFALPGSFGSGGLDLDSFDISGLNNGDEGGNGGIGGVGDGDWEIVNESYSDAGTVQEGESYEYNLVYNGYISSIRAVVFWEDEPDSLRWVNNPDEFQLDLRVLGDETDDEVVVSNMGENSQGGGGEVVCEFENDNVESDPYSRCDVILTLVNAGDYDKRIGIGIIGSRDDSNDYQVSVDVEYYTQVEVD